MASDDELHLRCRREILRLERRCEALEQAALSRVAALATTLRLLAEDRDDALRDKDDILAANGRIAEGIGRREAERDAALSRETRLRAEVERLRELVSRAVPGIKAAGGSKAPDWLAEAARLIPTQEPTDAE